MQRPSRSAASKARQSFQYSTGGDDDDGDEGMAEQPETEGSEDEYRAPSEAGSEGLNDQEVAEDDDDDDEIFSEEDEDDPDEEAPGKGGSKKLSAPKNRVKIATGSKKTRGERTNVAKRGSSSKQSRVPSAVANSTSSRSLNMKSLTRTWFPDKVDRVTSIAWPRDGAPLIESVSISETDMWEILTSWRTTPSGLRGSDLIDFGWTPDTQMSSSSFVPSHPSAFPTSINVLQDVTRYLTATPSQSKTIKPAPNFHPAIAFGTTIEVPIIAFEEQRPEIDPKDHTINIDLGPIGFQTKRSIGKFATENLDQLPSVIPDRAGHILNVGGHVYSVAWRPIPPSANTGKEYLAISASVDHQPRNAFGTRLTQPALAALQIWSVAPISAPKDSQPSLKPREYGKAKLEMLLCHESGPAWQVAWCPFGYDTRHTASKIRRLGLLAGTFHDGTLSIFTVPHPEDAISAAPEDARDGLIAVKLEPIVVLSLPNTTPHCFEWAGSETVAAGCADGSVAVWDIGEVLRRGTSTARPTHYFKAHDAPVLSISWLLRPNGSHRVSDEIKDGHNTPRERLFGRSLTTTALDGTVLQVDLSVPSLAAAPVARLMAPIPGACYVPAIQSLVCSRSRDEVAAVRGSMGDFRRAARLYQHHGPVQCIASSQHHPIIASGSADGSVIVCNVVHSLTKAKLTNAIKEDPSVTKLYRIDHDRTTGELRMLDNFREGLPLPPMIKGKSGKRSAPTMRRSFLWHPAISVNALDWCPNIGRGLLLASGTGCGLVRIDWVGQDGGIQGHGIPAVDLGDLSDGAE